MTRSALDRVHNRISRDVSVDRPLDIVAGYLSDVTTTVEWDPHTVSCRYLDDGPLRVGSRFENVQRIMGRNSTLRYTVGQYEPGKVILFEGGNRTIHTRDEMIFDRNASGGTTVTYTVEVELRGLARVGQALLPAAMKKIADEGAMGMRRRLSAL